MHSKRGKAMFDALPLYYDDSKLMKSLLDAQGLEIDSIRLALGDVLKQFYTDTIAEWGASEWEKELAITPLTDDLKMRQAIIKSKLLSPATVTVKQLEKIINCFVPNMDSTVTPYNHLYAFKIIMPSYVPPDMQNQMIKSVEESKPAHLAAIQTQERQRKQTIYFGTIQRHGRNTTILPAQIEDIKITARPYFGTVVHAGKNITIKARRV